jgi:predicted lactoylglutathione lyase
MAQGNGRKIFVNLAVRDLERSKDLFERLGFAIQEPAGSGAQA